MVAAVQTAGDLCRTVPGTVFGTVFGILIEWERGLAKEHALHTAESLFLDHGPANRHGIRSCWIHRRHDRPGFGATMPPEHTPSTDFRFTSMAEMVEAHRAELGG